MKKNSIDALCLKQIQEGNEHALLKLYAYFKKPLFLFVNRQLRDVQTSEEIVQDIFLASIDAMREKRQIKSISAYMYAIARHKIVDRLRRKKLKKILLSAIPEYVVNACAAVLFQEETRESEISDAVYHTLKKIPNEYALIIRLKYIEGLSVSDIAAKLTMSFKSAESMLFRARKAFVRSYQST